MGLSILETKKRLLKDLQTSRGDNQVIQRLQELKEDKRPNSTKLTKTILANLRNKSNNATQRKQG